MMRIKGSNKINKGIFHSLLLAVTQGIVALFFLGIDFFYSKKITVEQFGIWKHLLFVVNLIIPILSLGIAEGYKYYLAKDGDGNKTLFTNTYALYLYIAFGAGVIVLLANFLHYIGCVDLGHYYKVSFLLPIAYFAFVINKVLRYAYINEARIKEYTSITLVAFGATVILVIVFGFYFQKVIDSYLYIGLFLFIMLYLAPVFSLMKKGEYVATLKWVNRAHILNVLKQGLPLYIATFISVFILNTDKLIVDFFESKEVFAIFSVGALEVPIFAMLSTAFSQRDYPDLVRLISMGEKAEAMKLWMKTTKQVSFITYPILIILMFFAKEIIYTIYSPKYEASVYLFQTYLLVAIFRNNYYGALITASGQTKYITLYALMTLFSNVLLSFVLYQLLGVSGIVWGSVLSTIMVAFIQLQHEGMLKEYISVFLMDFRILFLIILLLVIYICG